MRAQLWHMAAALGVAATVAVPLLMVTNEAEGTEEMMARLPSSSRFRCSICHVSSAPTPESSAVNAFGLDFAINGFLWDAVLAQKNSDGDGCPNGFELGDRDADGKLDAGLVEEPGNPGNPEDCSVAIDEATWGRLKKLFEE